MARKKRKGKKRKEDKKRKKRKQRARSRRRSGSGKPSSRYSSRKSNKKSKRERRSSRASGRKKKKRGGKKKTKREGKRIEKELRSREEKGKREAKRNKRRKRESRPKNLGRSGERGASSRRAAQERQDRIVKDQVNKALEAQELVNSKRFGPLEDQYTSAMEKLGDVTNINQQLQTSIDDLKLSNSADLAAFNAESLRNTELINTMQTNADNQIQQLRNDAANERQVFQSSLAALQGQSDKQDLLRQEQLRIQQLQAKKASNLAKAYVPGQEDSLATVNYGDKRNKKRKVKDNRLSDLRLNSGLKTAAPSTSGLQLA